MSLSTVDILMIMPDSSNSKSIILEIDKILNDNFLTVEPGYLYYLNDYGETDFEPEDVVNAKDALEKVANWPTAGWLEYCFSGCSVLVSYKTSDDFHLSGVYLSIYEIEYNSRQEHFDNLVFFLHDRYKPLRTIKGIDIFNEFDPEDEIKRVKNSTFDGHYEIDLRG